MITKSIAISKDDVKAEFEVLTYKYASAIEGDGKPKAVRNIKSDRLDDDADELLVNSSFDRRVDEVVGIMRDFNPITILSAGAITVVFEVTGRWAGREESLSSLVDRYIIDGMLSDWLSTTAPSEAAIYTAKLPQDISDIKVELYKRKAP